MAKYFVYSIKENMGFYKIILLPFFNIPNKAYLRKETVILHATQSVIKKKGS